jgi:hypothetical protein
MRENYRVRRGSTPGTFCYSVLHNGVTSNEVRAGHCSMAWPCLHAQHSTLVRRPGTYS